MSASETPMTLTDAQMAVVREIAEKVAQDPINRCLTPFAIAEMSVHAALADPRLSRRDEWLPIENAPKDGHYVLMTDGEIVQEGYFDGEVWCSSHPQCQLWSPPTHWQPLPQPPEGK